MQSWLPWQELEYTGKPRGCEVGLERCLTPCPLRHSVSLSGPWAKGTQARLPSRNSQLLTYTLHQEVMTTRSTICTASPVRWEPSAALRDRHHLHLTKMHTTKAGEVTSLPTQSHSKPEAFPMLLVGVGAREYWRALEKEVCLEEVVLGLFLGDHAHLTP